ncbi:MAG: hypothetical protein LKH27_09705 [Prevotella sp.]|jgi:hypothetical protein|nr:hypothetical protein [Prevotella sp.]MCH3992157.1 hypothetical protein [Prevotella sp.]MCI1474670.1 hypothetical protein [Prevotella sp.]MCI1517991.1 hypothetical protein [Prevotella sp.]MCI1549656.1 hypothetical protein [Prevotella sp.]MCI1595835.1 hypothetical protein [Prevotella sp.]
MENTLTEEEEQIGEVQLTSPSVSRAIYRRYFNKSFIFDDLNEYMNHDRRFRSEMQQLFTHYAIGDDRFDFGRITDLGCVPSRMENTVIQLIVHNASPEYLKLKKSMKPFPERDGFFHFICSAFRTLPGTKRWFKLAHYFNVAANARKDNQLKGLHLNHHPADA